MTIADASFQTLLEIAGIGSLALILVGCVLLHLRLRRPASLSLLIALAAAVLWNVGGQDTARDLLTPPRVASSPTDASGMNAQAAIEALGRDAQVENAVLAVDALLSVWVALSFVFAVAVVRSHVTDPASMDNTSRR